MDKIILISNLIDLLEQAVNLSSFYTGGYSNRFLSAEEFHYALESSLQELKNGNLSVLETLHSYFAPTCSWDDFIHVEGIDLGNKIYDIILLLKP